MDDAAGGGEPHRDPLVRVVGRAGLGEGDVRERGVVVSAAQLGGGRSVGRQQVARGGGGGGFGVPALADEGGGLGGETRKTPQSTPENP